MASQKHRSSFVKSKSDGGGISAALKPAEVESKSEKQVSDSKHQEVITPSQKEYQADARWLPLSKIVEHSEFKNPRGSKFPLRFDMLVGAPKIYEMGCFRQVPADVSLGGAGELFDTYEVVGDFDTNGQGSSDELEVYIDRLYTYLNNNYPDMPGSENSIKDVLESLVLDALTIRRIDKLEQPIKVVKARSGDKYIAQEGHRRVCMHSLMSHSHILSIVANDNQDNKAEWLKAQLRADKKDRLSEVQLILALWDLSQASEAKGDSFGVNDVVRNSGLKQRSAYGYLNAVKACQMFGNDGDDNPVVDALNDGVLTVAHFVGTASINFPVRELRSGNKEAVLEFIRMLEDGNSPRETIKVSAAASRVDTKERLKTANKLLKLSPKDDSNDLMYWMLNQVLLQKPELAELLPEKKYTAEWLLKAVEIINDKRRDF